MRRMNDVLVVIAANCRKPLPQIFIGKAYERHNKDRDEPESGSQGREGSSIIANSLGGDEADHHSSPYNNALLGPIMP